MLTSTFYTTLRRLAVTPSTIIARPFSTVLPRLSASTSTANTAQASDSSSNPKDPKVEAAKQTDGATLKHFAFRDSPHPLDGVDVVNQLHLQRPAKKSYLLYEPAYTEEELNSIKVTHIEPMKFTDKLALRGIKMIRACFDFATGYNFLNFNEKLWLRRIIFLESIAGVPPMVAGMMRHLRSLRLMRRDHGWIHTLLAEAENERMHLLTFLTLKQPGYLFRLMVLAGQGVFFNIYFIAYALVPAACHRFVGYLEEEAVKTYTNCIKDLDAGKLPEWSITPAPEIAKKYWHLKDDAMMRDVLMAVRADEANHRDVNHTFSSLKADETNPFD